MSGTWAEYAHHLRDKAGRKPISRLSQSPQVATMSTIVADESHDVDEAVEAKKRLMVVDDQISLTNIVTTIAEDMGFAVTVVNDPTKALDVYLDLRPDILILDMIMPEKDGVDVLNEIMLTDITSQVILTSGFTESYARLAAGVAQFHNREPVLLLKKPFRRDKLVAVLREALARL